MKSLKKKYAVAALLPLLGLSAYAVVPNVTVTINASGVANVIRSDITRTIFGSGVEHQSYRFDSDPGDVMDGTNPTQTFIKNTVGTLRFPHGTTALYYYWNMPNQSYISRSGVTTSQILTPTEWISYTSAAQLNVERIFQVNTYAYKSPTLVYYQIPGSTTPITMNTTNRDLAAQSAADWVTNNFAQAAANRVLYWEVGNEDWNTWTPVEYANIFNAFADRMNTSATAASQPIKLLVQSYTGNFPLAGKATNTNAWLQDMLTAGGLHTTNVHALSEHEYLSTQNYPSPDTYATGREKQTRDMFAKIANDNRVPFLKGVLAANPSASNWQVWMTEYNVWPRGPDGTTQQLQDVGHAVVIADWTGRLLEQKTERLFMHGVDDNPYFSLINYETPTGTVAAPKITVPGYAFAKYVQEFGPKLVTNSITGNVSLSPADGTLSSYSQVSVYSSVRESDLTLRVMVINRSTVDAANMSIKTAAGRPMSGPSRNYSIQTLTSPSLTDSNKTVADYVKWSTPFVAASNTTAITATVPALSASLFIIPLQ